ncbi:hypothetical protein D3C79_48850 [compost metagenome]
MSITDGNNNERNARSEERREPEQPTHIDFRVPAMGEETLHDIILRGEDAERHSHRTDVTNGDLAIGLSKLAGYGNLNSHAQMLVSIAASRLAKANADRDLWKAYIPEGELLKDWELVDYQSYSGVVARFTIYKNGSGLHSGHMENAVKPQAIILMIENNGRLLEKRLVMDNSVGNLMHTLRNNTSHGRPGF